MELDESSIPEIAFVCSLHFEETDLDRTSLAYTRIRSHAVPFVCKDIEFISVKHFMFSKKVCIFIEKCKYK